MAFEAWNGSVWVTMTAGISPMERVTGATRAAISTLSSRPRTWSVRWSGAPNWADCRLRPSSKVTKSSRPRSASVTTSTQ